MGYLVGVWYGSGQGILNKYIARQRARSCKITPMYLCARGGRKAWSPKGPWGLAGVERFKVTFVFFSRAACIVWILHNDHVLFIEPEIAHRRLFSLTGREEKEACSDIGTLWLRGPDVPCTNGGREHGHPACLAPSWWIHPACGGKSHKSLVPTAKASVSCLSVHQWALVSCLNVH